MRFGNTTQDIIHLIEEGAGARVLRWSLLLLATLMLLVAYNWRCYRNMATPDAMDAAQLARNIADGKGYTTLFVRPLSVYLVKRVNEKRGAVAGDSKLPDYARIRAAYETNIFTLHGRSVTNVAVNAATHPDLANPPVYPVVLAGVMKVLPFNYGIPGTAPGTEAKTTKYFWNKDGRFWWYPPDFYIALFNQLLLLGAVLLAYLLARFLFDSAVAWLSALLLLGTELFWRFSVSGLSTMLLVLIFLGLSWSLVLLERAARLDTSRPSTLYALSAAAGLLVVIGALTRYAFAWVIVPVLVFIVLFSGNRRLINCLLAFVVFAAVLTPWIVRNYHVSGTPFGTATYTVMEGTPAFPEYRLARSLSPDFSQYDVGHFWRKLLGNSRQIVQTDLPKLCGNWLSAFFLVGLMFSFRSPAINRLKYFLLMCVPVLAVVQALGRTQLSEESPEINYENVLFLLAPLVVVYGVSLFYKLLDRIALPVRQLRYLIIGAFAAVMCLPMILIFLPPKTFPIAYPPYYPPHIQKVSNWMGEKELTMSDVPWAVAWYGRRQCIWLTLNAQADFFAVNDYMKPVQALYLTPRTMDGRFLSDWIHPHEYSWGSLVLDSVIRKEIPPNFPLRKAFEMYWPEEFFLTDWERWRKP